MSSDVDDLAREVERWRKAAAKEGERAARESARADEAERRVSDLDRRIRMLIESTIVAFDALDAVQRRLGGVPVTAE